MESWPILNRHTSIHIHIELNCASFSESLHLQTNNVLIFLGGKQKLAITGECFLYFKKQILDETILHFFEVWICIIFWLEMWPHCKKNSGNLRKQVQSYCYIMIFTFKLLTNRSFSFQMFWFPPNLNLGVGRSWPQGFVTFLWDNSYNVGGNLEFWKSPWKIVGGN